MADIGGLLKSFNITNATSTIFQMNTNNPIYKLIDQVPAKVEFPEEMWSNVFKALGFGASIPEEKVGSPEFWKETAFHSAAPAVIIGIGLITAFSVLCALCRNQKATATSYPSKFPLCLLVTLTIGVVWGGFAMSSQFAQKGVDVNEKMFHELKADLKVVVDLTGKALAATEATYGNMTNFEASCSGPTWEAAKTKAAADGVDLNAECKKYSTAVNTILGAVLSKVNFTNVAATGMYEAAEKLDKQVPADSSTYLSLAVIAPAALMTLISILIVVEVWLTCDSKCLVKFVECCVMRFQAAPLAVTIFVMSVLTALLLALGIFLASFCEAPDDNVLKITKHILDATNKTFVQTPLGTLNLYDTVDYYVLGGNITNGTEHIIRFNPIMEQLGRVNQMIYGMKAEFNGAYGTLATLLEGSCSAVKAADVQGTLNLLISTVSSSFDLFQRSHIYPIYTEIVYTQTCDNMIRGLGWVFLSTALTSIFLLPTVVILSHRYLTQMDSVREFDRKKAEMEEAEKQRLLDERSKPVVERAWWSCCSTNGRPA